MLNGIWSYAPKYDIKNSPLYAKQGILIKSQPVVILNFWGVFSAKKQQSIYQTFTLTRWLLRILAFELKYEATSGKVATDYWKSIKGLPVKKQEIVIDEIDKGRSYEHLILLHQADFQLFEAANLLKSTFDAQNQIGISYHFVNNDYLKLSLQSGYEFHFEMNKSTHIIAESKEMATTYKGKLDKTKIGQCAARIEFWGDGDDMLYFYDFTLVLQAFSDRTKFFVYDQHQGFLE